MSGPVALTWQVGVRNRFGWVTLPDSTRHLVEVRMFLPGPIAHLMDLHTGDWLIVAADGSSLLTPVDPARACGLVGIPAPQTDNTKEDPVRVDPFHVERHRSPVFRAICDLAYARSLPCGTSLLAHEDGHWQPGDYERVHQDNPEQFATDVGLAIAADGHRPAEAIRLELCADAGVDPDAPAAARLLLTTGWHSALRSLDAAITAQRQLVDAGAPLSELHARAMSDDASAPDGSDQLALV